MDIEKILAEHSAWLYSCGEDGERANLSDVNLSDVNLSDVNLRGVNLSDADLSGADLSGVNLSGVNLWGANLRGVNLSGVNLWGANLSGANLSGADLSDADLRGTAGNMGEIKSIFVDTYPITYTATHLQIGCKRFEIDQWWRFTNDEIDGMDDGALGWWKKWRDTIKSIIEISPATRTEVANEYRNSN